MLLVTSTGVSVTKEAGRSYPAFCAKAWWHCHARQLSGRNTCILLHHSSRASSSSLLKLMETHQLQQTSS